MAPALVTRSVVVSEAIMGLFELMISVLWVSRSNPIQVLLLSRGAGGGAVLDSRRATGYPLGCKEAIMGTRRRMSRRKVRRVPSMGADRREHGD